MPIGRPFEQCHSPNCGVLPTSRQNNCDSVPSGRTGAKRVLNVRVCNRNAVGVMIALPAILAATFVAYLPGLTGPLLLDDIPQLGGLIEQSAEAPTMLFGNYIVSTSGPLGRPVSMATFIVDAIAHGPDTWWWKYGSVMYHLITGLLFAWFIALLVKLSPLRLPVDPWVVGLLVAAFWLLHPLNVSTVLYTVQRMTVLSTLFVFAGLVCYARGRLAQLERTGSGWISLVLAFGLFLPLAILSKESGLLFVVYCTLVELLICRFRGNRCTRKSLKILHGLFGVGYVAAFVFLVLNSDFVLEGYAFRDFTLLERVLTQFRVLVVYMSQILIPLPVWMGFFHDDFQLSTGLFQPLTTAPSIILVIGLMAGAITLRRRFPLAAFGVLFFFSSHAIESTIFGLELMFEHRNYTGSAGLLLALVVLGVDTAFVRRAMPASAFILLAGFSLLTWQRASIWSAPDVMYRHMYAVHPDSSRLNIIFSNINASAGEFEHARRLLLKVEPGLGRTLHERFLDCLEHGRIEDPGVRELLRIKAGVVDGYVTSTASLIVRAVLEGRCVMRMNTLLDGLNHLLDSRDRSPMDRRSILFLKAELLERLGDAEAAVLTFRQAQQLSGIDALPGYYAADLLARHGRLEEARAKLQEARAIESTSRIEREDLAEKIYSGIAELYRTRQQYAEALAVYEEAASHMPGQAEFPLLSAELLLHVGKYGRAAEKLAEIQKLPLSATVNHRDRIEKLVDALGDGARQDR